MYAKSFNYSSKSDKGLSGIGVTYTTNSTVNPPVNGSSRSQTAHGLPHRRKLLLCPFLLLVSIVSAIILLTILSLTIARPGLWAINFKETTCSPINSTSFEDRKCTCSSDSTCEKIRCWCTSSTPCLQIRVRYNITSNKITLPVTSVIYQNEHLGFEGGRCSVMVCNKDAKQNVFETYQILLPKYGTLGTNYTCLYNPESPQSVIVERNIPYQDSLMAILIPSAVIVFSFVLLMLVLRCNGWSFIRYH